MNHALLRYDPTGHFTQLQEAVRAVYLQPFWLAKRLHYWLEVARTHVAGFQEAVATDNLLSLAEHARWAAGGFASLPLLRAGIAPSGSRCLIQLGTVAPELQEQLYAFIGASTQTAADVLALEPWLHEWMSLVDRTKHGQLLDYFAWKALWLAEHGYPQTGFACLFAVSAVIAEDCRQDTAKVAQATALAQRWLPTIHWSGQPVLAAKVALAQSLLRQIETLAIDLPNPSGGKAGELA